LRQAFEIADLGSAAPAAPRFREGREREGKLCPRDAPVETSMSALTIDTLAVAQTLRKRGFSEEQATGVVEALQSIDAGALATKADLRQLKLEAKIEKLEAKIDVVAPI
jgi:hypothetical protein